MYEERACSLGLNLSIPMVKGYRDSETPGRCLHGTSNPSTSKGEGISGTRRPCVSLLLWGACINDSATEKGYVAFFAPRRAYDEITTYERVNK